MTFGVTRSSMNRIGVERRQILHLCAKALGHQFDHARHFHGIGYALGLCRHREPFYLLPGAIRHVDGK